MSTWQPLPEELPAEVRHFVEQLRLLKDRTGLSLVALGRETAYSKSSWQRYLNGTQPPPRQAVAALCRVAGLVAPDAERFGVRRELAVKVWPRDAAAPAGGVRGGPAGRGAAEAYEGEPTLPWWDLLNRDGGEGSAPAAPLEPEPEPELKPEAMQIAPPWRLFAYTAVAVIALLLAGLLWAVAQMPDGPSGGPAPGVGTTQSPGFGEHSRNGATTSR